MTWNKHHVALGTMGYNFCWFHPRKSAAHCHMHVRVTSDVRDTVVQSLEDAGIAASPFRNETVILKLRKKELEDNSSLVAQVLCCEWPSVVQEVWNRLRPNTRPHSIGTRVLSTREPAVRR